MKYTTLDKIVRGFLAQKQWSIHYYIQCMVYAQRCLEELHFDTLGIINTTKLSINSMGIAKLPCDYLDFCMVGISNGQYISPLSQRNRMNRLNNFEASDEILSSDSELFTSLFGAGNFNWFNDNMEMTGRIYGSAGNQSRSFLIIPEREEIEFDRNLGATHAIMTYISDGSECNAATRITPYSKSTFEAYMELQHRKSHRSYGDSAIAFAEQQVTKQHRILRSRSNDITLTDIKNSYRRRSHGSIKG